jgi:hypothetical protein
MSVVELVDGLRETMRRKEKKDTHENKKREECGVLL